MNKIRTAIPKAIKEKVLSEYNHRCAICGADKPQVHHIDENPENNELHNLLPLCPNHHLNDQHNPTTKIEPLRLRLFRKYKDPQILSPQFEPIFNRMTFLLAEVNAKSFDSITIQVADLVKFISHLNLGEYYQSRLYNLLDWSGPAGYTLDTREEVYARHLAQYLERISENKALVIELIVEQLRFQFWPTYVAKA